MSTWVVVLGFNFGVASGVISYLAQVMLINPVDAGGSVEAALAVTQFRVDSFRNSITVAATIGGASALLLSFRRQQHEEYNSTQQRITELRIQAVAQLGSDSPTVRIGGLHNLERLGEQHQELRQIVLDEICSYLRLPYAPPNTSTAVESGQTKPSDAAVSPDALQSAEREVRFIAQEILQRRLRRGKRQQPAWGHDRINLRGALLEHIDFRNCHLQHAAFADAIFSGDADFEDATFGGKASFKGTSFNEAANFANAVFGGNTAFTSASFHENTSFKGATFIREPDFRDAIFSKPLETMGDLDEWQCIADQDGKWRLEPQALAELSTDRLDPESV